MLGYCRSAALTTVVETAQVEARTAPYFLFVTAATDRTSMPAGLLTDRTNYTRPFSEITSGNACAFKRHS